MLIEGKSLFQSKRNYSHNGAAFIGGWHIFEAWHLSEEIWYQCIFCNMVQGGLVELQPSMQNITLEMCYCMMHFGTEAVM